MTPSMEVYEVLIGLAVIMLAVWGIKQLLKYAVVVAVTLLLVAGGMYMASNKDLQESVQIELTQEFAKRSR